MSAWNDIQDHLDDTGQKEDGFSERWDGKRRGDYTQRAKTARDHIKGIVFELEAKADERDHLRKMLSQARADVTNLELALERLESRWDAALDERIAEIESNTPQEPGQ